MNAHPKPQKVDVDYYNWLISQIKIGSPSKTYFELFEIMHNTEFVWWPAVPRDKARVGDGKQLRYDYFRFELHSQYEDGNLDIEGISFLEVLVALSRRFAWVMSDQGNEPYWAWRLIKNLGLNRMSDPLSNRDKKRIGEILYNVIWRNYEPSGEGGFFPLENTVLDQRNVDIWYQMQEYAIEKDPIN